MKRTILLFYTLMVVILAHAGITSNIISVTEKDGIGAFPLSGAAIYTDNADYKVVGIAGRRCGTCYRHKATAFGLMTLSVDNVKSRLKLHSLCELAYNVVP